MGRAQKRMFLRKHPYCDCCLRNGNGKVKTTKAIGNTPLCDECYEGLMNAYRGVGLKDEDVQKAAQNGGISMEYHAASEEESNSHPGFLTANDNEVTVE